MARAFDDTHFLAPPGADRFDFFDPSFALSETAPFETVKAVEPVAWPGLADASASQPAPEPANDGILAARASLLASETDAADHAWASLSHAAKPAAGWVSDLLGQRAAAPVPAPSLGEVRLAPGLGVPLGGLAAASPTAEDYTGAGQRIVVIDDGFSAAYDQSNTLGGLDFSGANDYDAEVDTVASHGSWVAQTAITVAPQVEIIHLKVFDDDGEGASLRDIEEALAWVDAFGGEYGVAAVNLSLGFGNTTEETWTMLSDEIAALDAQGIFTVVASGNAGRTHDEGVNVIAADPNAIAVSAAGADGGFAAFSQNDPELTDITAPGTQIPVTTSWGASFTVDGTSFAAPYVSGTAALLQEAADDLLGHGLTDEQFLEILQLSGGELAGEGPEAPAGYTLADAEAALAYFIETHEAYADPLLV